MQASPALSGALASIVPTVSLAQHTGQRVQIAGWLHRYRQLGKVSFLILRDPHGLAQIVIDPGALDEQIAALGAESVLSITGDVVAEPQAPGGVEIHHPEVTVLSAVEESLPFDLYRPELGASLPTQLDHGVLANRHPQRRAYFEITAALLSGFRRTLDALDFREIQSPKLVASATESGANVFEVDYFDRTAYLAQSPQFYKQMMVGVFGRVYETGPVFRAEPHDTARHLNEYVSLDAELGFIDDHRTVGRVLREVIAGMITAVEERCAPAMDLPTVPEELPILHFADAMEMLSAAFGEDLRNEPDLAPAHERWLGEWAEREHGAQWLVIEGYPMVKRPFYTHPDPDRPGYSRGFDLLFRGIELVTGGQRLHRYADYLRALEQAGLDPEPFASYLEAFRYGMPPHGGFAIGLERFVARLVEVDNIREVTLFPRTITRLTP